MKKKNRAPKRKNRAPKEDGSLPFVSVAGKATAAEEKDPQPTKNNISESESKPQPVSTQPSSSNEPRPQPTNGSSTNDLSEMGSEIKKAMREREGKDEVGGGDFWSGVAEEIREKVLIQWETPQPTNRAPVVVWL